MIVKDVQQFRIYNGEIYYIKSRKLICRGTDVIYIHDKHVSAICPREEGVYFADEGGHIFLLGGGKKRHIWNVPARVKMLSVGDKNIFVLLADSLVVRHSDIFPTFFVGRASKIKAVEDILYFDDLGGIFAYFANAGQYKGEYVSVMRGKNFHVNKKYIVVSALNEICVLDRRDMLPVAVIDANKYYVHISDNSRYIIIASPLDYTLFEFKNENPIKIKSFSWPFKAGSAIKWIEVSDRKYIAMLDTGGRLHITPFD